MRRHADDSNRNSLSGTILNIEDMSLPLEYKFLPGANSNDGLSIDVPIEALNQFDQHQMDYLVPGSDSRKDNVVVKVITKTDIRKTLSADSRDSCRNVPGTLSNTTQYR